MNEAHPPLNPPGTPRGVTPAVGPATGPGSSDDTPAPGAPLDAAVAAASTQPDLPPPAQPVDGDWRADGRGPTAAPEPEQTAPRTAGALESLGRAITQPLVDAAETDPADDPRPEPPPHAGRSGAGST
jgi:hypothetical protein